MITLLHDHNNRQHQGIVQLHEENQSLLLLKQFDWENAVTFTFKDQTRLVIMSSIKRNEYFFLRFFSKL